MLVRYYEKDYNYLIANMSPPKVNFKSYQPRLLQFDNPKTFSSLPKNIFQTWESGELTPKMYHAMQSWQTLNPDWNHYFFTSKERWNYIQDNFSQEILEAYDSLVPGAYKADLWRYCILYHMGGVYADIKIILNNSLYKLLDLDTEFTSVKERDGYHLKGAIWNTFIASKPKHPFLKTAIDMIVENVKNGEYGKNALYPTGPFLLGRAINTVLGRKDYAAFKTGKQIIGDYEFTLWYMPKKNIVSRQQQYVYINRNRKLLCFQVSYNGYREEKKFYSGNVNRSFDYAYCWRNFQAYNKPSNPSKLLYPTLKQIKFAYQESDYHKARQLIIETMFRRKQFHLKLIRYIIQYELKYIFSIPASNLVKLKALLSKKVL